MIRKMKSPLIHSTSFNSLFITLFTISFFLFQISYSQDTEIDTLKRCLSHFNCGTHLNLSYPFWNHERPEVCREEGFGLTKCDEVRPVVNISGLDFRVIHVNQDAYTMTIARENLWQSICHANPVVPLPNSPSDGVRNLWFFSNCTESTEDDDYDNFLGRVPPTNRLGCTTEVSFYADDSLFNASDIQALNGSSCDNVIPVQVHQRAFGEFQSTIGGLSQQLQVFDLVYNLTQFFCWKCNGVGGNCGSEGDGTSDRYPICNPPEKHDNGINWKAKLGIGVGAGVGGILIASIGFFCWLRHRRGKIFTKSSYASGKSSSDRSSMLDPEKGINSFSSVYSLAGVHLFTYAELEEATNNFDSDKELGDGGFGTVYYGKLRDGRAVAVKRLYENNYRRVEQFMNEVEILTRLRHKNLVSLYGCTSRHSRELLLVYEFVPNGTVADHLHGQHAKPGALPWSTRLQIAIETADALRYLHASDTIHRDVKTNNILLDKNFSVKVADFGLSRLFPTDVTHVSTAPQGTPGYVDPEYHQCYQLTDKSDVFSFGVVLIELISSKPAVDITRHRHEINLSNMAINKIQNRALHELVDPSLGYESNNKVMKMITGMAEVAFMCLQNEKDMRPTMAEVFEALIGIQKEDYSKSKAEVMEISTDEVVLLKNGQLPGSPDSVMIKWVSNGSTIPSVGN